MSSAVCCNLAPQGFGLQRAKAVVDEKATPEQHWISPLDGRMPFGKVIVAITNIHARQIWVMLAHDVDYAPPAPA